MPSLAPQQSKPFATFACTRARAGGGRRRGVAPAEHLELPAQARSQARLVAQQNLQSFSDLLGNRRTVDMIDVNSAAHGSVLTRSKPNPVLQAQGPGRRDRRLWLSARALVLNSGSEHLWLSATCAVFQRRAAVSSVKIHRPDFGSAGQARVAGRGMRFAAAGAATVFERSIGTFGA